MVQQQNRDLLAEMGRTLNVRSDLISVTRALSRRMHRKNRTGSELFELNALMTIVGILMQDEESVETIEAGNLVRQFDDLVRFVVIYLPNRDPVQYVNSVLSEIRELLSGGPLRDLPAETRNPPPA